VNPVLEDLTRAATLTTDVGAGPDAAHDREAAWDHTLRREWLVTDGLGGYASGTVVGPQTRRYHGLLVAPLAIPLGRHVLVSKLEEAVETAGRTYPLSTNEFQDGTIAPRGFERLTAFTLDDGVPTWQFTAGDATVEKRVWMERGHSTTYVRYTLQGAPARLHLTPLCVFRDFHRETIGSEDWRFRVEPLTSEQLDGAAAGGITVRAYAGATPFHILLAAPPGSACSYGGDQGWWWHVLHRVERARGLDYLEDLYATGTFTVDLTPGQHLLLAATVEEPDDVARRLASGTLAPPSAAGTAATVGRSRQPSAAAPPAHDEDAEFVAQLRRAAQQFLVPRAVPGEPEAIGPDGLPAARTVLAGYHWFGDWGRDTAIGLPGLALATGRFDEARAILLAFSRYVDRGMLPNRFPDTGAPLNDGDYNTVDATLWYFHAVDAIDRATGGGLVETLFPVLEEIVGWHVEGTRFGIRMDPADGLIRVENPQLTWMDAKVGDWVVTPRAGKPVEIAALWHHALTLMEQWAVRFGRADAAARYAALRAAAAAGFRARYWYAAGGYLYDLVDAPRGDAPGDDARLRPNQIVAAALPDCPLADVQRKSIVDVVAAHLWTPRGLRTLAPDDPQYKGHYGGDPWFRDGAYHQGTVWPWLLGPFVDAHLLVYADPHKARAFVAPLRDHLFAEACAGSISEIFDGDPPYRPDGCIAQAWSVAEVIRAWMATEPAGH
jgi:glycogen debranching enzyme